MAIIAFQIEGRQLLNGLLSDAIQKKHRIFHDIVQNWFDTYPPYLIMILYIYDIVVFFRHLPTFM